MAIIANLVANYNKGQGRDYDMRFSEFARALEALENMASRGGCTGTSYCEVVGVVKDIKYERLTEQPRPVKGPCRPAWPSLRI